MKYLIIGLLLSACAEEKEVQKPAEQPRCAIVSTETHVKWDDSVTRNTTIYMCPMGDEKCQLWVDSRDKTIFEIKWNICEPNQ